MNSTEVFTITENGKFTLPDDITERYHFKKETDFRIIETQNGVLLVPLTDEPMNFELKAEIEEWQSIGQDSLDLFEYKEPASLQSETFIGSNFPHAADGHKLVGGLQ